MPLKEHRIDFTVFTGDYSLSKRWLVQTRLGTNGSEWSAPSPRRAFEFSNLSDGHYQFEARSVNSGGMVSPTTRFSFTILPPWYRTPWAYGGYTAGLAAMVFGFVRMRDHQIRRRNRELEEQVRTRTAELERASAAKDDFIAGISHEIRNPMNGVVGIAESLKLDGLDPESRRRFGLLRQCANHLASLLEDILDFSKIQAGTLELEEKPFEVPGLADSITAMTAVDSEKYGIPVEVAVDPAVPRFLIGDQRRVRQILLNFVTNALKFSGRGQVRLTVMCKTPGRSPTEVVFAVSDDGPGITPGEQARLFVRFERGTDARQGRVPGTGLGLALCKGLAEKMGGRIWLESQPGLGSCFYFSAPFTWVEAGDLSPPDPAPIARDGFQTALVVDDEEHNRIVLTDHLETMGFAVHIATEGGQALALASTHTFHVVFLDFDLPGLTGLEISRRIRALPGPTAGALIVATTAFNTPDKRAQCRAAGMNAFVGKPVSAANLRLALTSSPTSFAQVAAPATPSSGDSLSNLRRLAARKQSDLADEIAAYFSEFETELARLESALQSEDTTGVSRYAHLLSGRCGFTHARELSQTVDHLVAATQGNQWAAARSLHDRLQKQMEALRVTLAADAPVAPRG